MSTNSTYEIKVMINHKNRKTSNLVMTNNVHFRQDVLEKTNIVSEFKCSIGYDQVATYIDTT